MAKTWTRSDGLPTWAEQVRAMEIGDRLEIPSDHYGKQSKYIGAKRSCPDRKFKIVRENGKVFIERQPLPDSQTSLEG